MGGGGGVAGSVGLSPTVGYIGSGGGSGSGGTVAVDMLGGTIATSGDSAHGIFAQSVGGSTANGSPGKGGNVTVNVTGQIQTSGADSNGIMVQSKGQGGNGQITVTINAGSTVQGGTGYRRRPCYARRHFQPVQQQRDCPCRRAVGRLGHRRHWRQRHRYATLA